MTGTTPTPAPNGGNGTTTVSNTLDLGNGAERVDDIAGDTIDTGADVAAKPAAAAAEAAEQDTPTPVVAGSHGGRLAEIAARVKAKKAAEAHPDFTGDMSDPSQSYGNAGRTTADEPVAEPAADALPAVVSPPIVPAADAAPKKRTVKVRGKTLELTEEELEEAAMKSLAADSYLKDAKEIYQGAKKHARSEDDPHRPEDDDDVVEDPKRTPEADDDQRQVFKRLVEDIQLGDPEEVAAKVQDVISTAVQRELTQKEITRKVSEDFDTSQKEATAFRKKNEDLLKDPDAFAAIERRVLNMYRDDLAKIGFKPEQLPRDPDQLGDFYRAMRVTGRVTRSTADLLNKATEDYQAKFTTQPTPSKVAVNRDGRRASIPVSTPRASATPAPAAAQSQPNTRAATIARMREQRAARVTATR
jgi:hypothetical protein